MRRTASAPSATAMCRQARRRTRQAQPVATDEADRLHAQLQQPAAQPCRRLCTDACDVGGPQQDRVLRHRDHALKPRLRLQAVEDLGIGRARHAVECAVAGRVLEPRQRRLRCQALPRNRASVEQRRRERASARRSGWPPALPKARSAAWSRTAPPSELAGSGLNSATSGLSNKSGNKTAVAQCRELRRDLSGGENACLHCSFTVRRLLCPGLDRTSRA